MRAAAVVYRVQHRLRELVVFFELEKAGSESFPDEPFLAAFKNGEDRYRAALVPRPEVCLNIDARQTGLGGASCGPGPMWKYRFDSSKPVGWTYRLESVAR